MGVLERLGEFPSAWESFGTLGRFSVAFGRVLEDMGGVWSTWEGFGAHGRVLERMGEFWSVYERFGAFEWESYRPFMFIHVHSCSFMFIHVHSGI